MADPSPIQLQFGWPADLPVSKLNFMGVEDEEEEEGRDVWAQKKQTHSKGESEHTIWN